MAAKKGQASRYFAGFIMLLLIVGLGGFGARNFGGRVNSVASVGDTEIDVNRYARALNEELRQLQQQIGQPFTLSQAQQFGVDRNVLQRLITTAAFENENKRLGLSVGDEEVQRQLLATPAFQGVAGSFDRDNYIFALERTGMTSAQYESALRSQTAGEILQLAVSGGIAAPATYTKVVMEFIGERRSFSWLELNRSSLVDPIVAPNDAELQSYFAAHTDDYMVPAAKKLTYAWLSPDTLTDQITVEEATLRALYGERSAEYNLPERRLVERLIYATDDVAQTALDAIKAGTSTFEEAVAARGLTLSDIDLGDITPDALKEAGDAVFAMTEPGVSDVLETEFGPAIFRVNAILAARSTSFEDARQELLQEFVADSTRRLIADQISEFDDLLAAGATPEELSVETDMQLGQINWSQGVTSGIAAYSAFQEEAAQATIEGFPAIVQLDDGGIFTLRMDEAVAAHPESFDNVRERVRADWTQNALNARLVEEASLLLAQLDAGATLSSLGHPVSVETNVTRSDQLDATPPEFLQSIFALEPGQSATTQAPGRLLIAKLDAVLPADQNAPDAEAARQSINEQLVQSLGQDALTAFTNTLVSQAGISINQSAMNAVHAQFP